MGQAELLEAKRQHLRCQLRIIVVGLGVSFCFDRRFLAVSTECQVGPLSPA